jgi:NADH-quinone oxidoreductase subunit I
MTLAEKIYLPAIFKGMGITLKHAVRNIVKGPNLSLSGSDKPRAEIWRGQHVLEKRRRRRERCTACGLCAVACPAEAITMTAAERTKDEKDLYREEKYAQYMKSIC